MQESKFSWIGLVGYLVLLSAATFGIIFVLNNFNTPEVTSTPKEVVAETTPVSQNSKMQENVTELKVVFNIICPQNRLKGYIWIILTEDGL